MNRGKTKGASSVVMSIYACASIAQKNAEFQGRDISAKCVKLRTVLM